MTSFLTGLFFIPFSLGEDILPLVLLNGEDTLRVALSLFLFRELMLLLESWGISISLSTKSMTSGLFLLRAELEELCADGLFRLEDIHLRPKQMRYWESEGAICIFLFPSTQLYQNRMIAQGCAAADLFTPPPDSEEFQEFFWKKQVCLRK